MTQPYQITLPWPPSKLSPNARLHYMALSKAKKAYRLTCAQECMGAGLPRMGADLAEVFIDFHPPDRRKRDDDNIIASFKAGRDGVADRIGIDDHKWQTTYRVRKEPSEAHPKGAVVLWITPLTIIEHRGQVS